MKEKEKKQQEESASSPTDEVKEPVRPKKEPDQEKQKSFATPKFISSLSELSKGQQSCIEGLCLLHGHGVEPDIEEAVRLLNKSAQLGEPRAFFVLGEIQEFGIGCRVDKREALSFYQKAAQLGEPSAQLKLARMFLSEVNARDSQVAYAAAGLIGSTEMSISASGISALPENQKVALYMFRKAADAGLPEAIAQLGQIYESGGYEDDKTGRFFPLVRRNQEKAL